jgi:hypothetical protein
MTVELGSVVLEHLTEVAVQERARIKHHAVPGMAGNLAQVMGRPSVEVRIRGMFYGAQAAQDLKKLRDAYLKAEPLDFFAEAKGEGYFAQVLIMGLEVSQRAGYLDEFDYVCEVVEYVKPPSAVGANPLGAVDTAVLGEAAAFMDDVQNGLAQVAALKDLAGAFQNPAVKLGEMPAQYTEGIGDGADALTSIAALFTGGDEGDGS